MTLYTVEGTFRPTTGPGAPLGNTLSGTIDITAGAITAMDLVVPTFPLHFTQIYFNQPHFRGQVAPLRSNSWLLRTCRGRRGLPNVHL
jgi:hypothetical protein